ncbi:MAG: hypothetical protein MJ025_06495 [Victivallaceae bacterium]|nr:hypothetical protein [Victivallaceae bacterium]
MIDEEKTKKMDEKIENEEFEVSAYSMDDDDLDDISRWDDGGDDESCDEEADSYIRWAAGRAAAIAAIPLPLADIAPLIANEVYMIHRLAGVYDKRIDESVVTMLLGCAGGAFAGKMLASFLPFIKIGIAAGITYALGKAVKAYFKSSMKLGIDEIKRIFEEEKKKNKGQKWEPIDEDEPIEVAAGCGAMADEKLMNAGKRFQVPSVYAEPTKMLLEHFENTRDQLPIEGGWGYSADDAVVIKSEDPEINPGNPLDGISVENVFIHYRIREELEYVSPVKYHLIDWHHTGQRLVYINGRPHDVVAYVVETMPGEKWTELCDDYAAHNGYKDDPEGLAKLDARRDALIERYAGEAYMDISDWFGRC